MPRRRNRQIPLFPDPFGSSGPSAALCLFRPRAGQAAP